MPMKMPLARPAGLIPAALATAFLAAAPVQAQDTLKLGLVAAMSGQSAKSGEAIVRGLSLAIDEINAKGGLLGKKVELLVRDDESTPAKGVLAARELVEREKVAALFGGLDTPVSIAIVPFANQTKTPFMGVWAAGTPITQNGAAKNYVFRVSAVDDLVDVELVDYAVKKSRDKKPGLILINNPWGESNEKGLKAALAAKNVPLCRHREIRDRRHRHRPAVEPAQAGRKRRAVARGQRGAVGAGGEVARPHELGRPHCLPLGSGGRTVHRARGRERGQGALHPDLQLLRQCEPQVGCRARRAEEEISRDQVAGRRHPGGRHCQCLRRDASHRARHRQGWLDRGTQDPRGLLRDRQL